MKPITVALIYSDYFKRSNKIDYLAEEDVFEARGFVETALSLLGYDYFSLALGKDVYQFISRLKQRNFDMVFNLVEGFLGKSALEMNICAVLDLFNVAYTGSEALVIASALDKLRTKEILTYYKLKVPAGRVYANVKNIPKRGKYPLIVKPLLEDASIGISKDSVVYNYQSLRRQVEYILDTYKQQAMVEKFIEGREFNVAVYGNQSNSKLLPIAELTYDKGVIPRICGYEAKWLKESKEYKGTRPLCPAKIGKKLKEKIQKTALIAYRSMNIRDYGRIDIRMDNNNELYILEVNPNPCLSPGSGFSKALKAAKIPFKNFIKYIIGAALKRKK